MELATGVAAREREFRESELSAPRSGDEGRLEELRAIGYAEWKRARCSARRPKWAWPKSDTFRVHALVDRRGIVLYGRTRDRILSNPHGLEGYDDALEAVP